MKVLVIEDNDSARMATSDLLACAGYTVGSAPDGRAGLDMIAADPPDLILCDINMPGLSGYDTLAELRRRPVVADTPFIFLTAVMERENVRRGMELGADDYLTKPFTRDELMKAVSAQMNKRAFRVDQYRRRLDELRSSIALALPHEMRTPLFGVQIFSDLLLERSDSLTARDVRQIATHIRDSGARLKRLVERFLTYTEVELALKNETRIAQFRGLSTPDTRPLVLVTAVDLAERIQREDDLRMQVTHARARVVDYYFQMIVEELVDNALKFSDPGTPVTVCAGGDNGEYVLAISDHGRGMTAEQIAAVGPYVQFDRQRYEQQGVGLGLALVGRLVDLHGGKLAISSEPGLGTSVRVTLPA